MILKGKWSGGKIVLDEQPPESLGEVEVTVAFAVESTSTTGSFETRQLAAQSEEVWNGL